MRTALALAIIWTALVPESVSIVQAAPARADRVSVSYVPPKDPAHQTIYRRLQDVRFLEKLQEFLSPFRLPRKLLVKMEGCAGAACTMDTLSGTRAVQMIASAKAVLIWDPLDEPGT